MEGNETLQFLRKAIVEGDRNQSIALTHKALETGLEVREIIARGLVKGADEVGYLYEQATIFLPELLLAGNAMSAVMEILTPRLKNSAQKGVARTVLIGTPEGDIHSIGKNIIGLLLQGQGYNVIDLGTDIPPMQFVEKAKEMHPDVIGLSGLMTTTVIKMQETILLLREGGIDAKVIVGGGIVNEESCKMVGADDFAVDGWEGIKKIRKLLELKTQEST